MLLLSSRLHTQMHSNAKFQKLKLKHTLEAFTSFKSKLHLLLSPYHGVCKLPVSQCQSALYQSPRPLSLQKIKKALINRFEELIIYLGDYLPCAVAPIKLQMSTTSKDQVTRNTKRFMCNV